MFLNYIQLFALFAVGKTQSTCRPMGSDGIPICCPYFYLKGNKCFECPEGYQVIFGENNCSVPCYYPSYGARCGQQCSCSKEDCHHVHGCNFTRNIYKVIPTCSGIAEYSPKTDVLLIVFVYGLPGFFILVILCQCIVIVVICRNKKNATKETNNLYLHVAQSESLDHPQQNYAQVLQINTTYETIEERVYENDQVDAGMEMGNTEDLSG
uniref:Uncharacterized protein LOC111104660 isoform X1 n=1 Tax=Crassostrea virginica TaxID=6565 RepID=A0A8B8AUS4_CRAVI|nr:uncharacterized protein LOC111104660 isoform X1 [Crassostrea virginica]